MLLQALVVALFVWLPYAAADGTLELPSKCDYSKSKFVKDAARVMVAGIDRTMFSQDGKISPEATIPYQNPNTFDDGICFGPHNKNLFRTVNVIASDGSTRAEPDVCSNSCKVQNLVVKAKIRTVEVDHRSCVSNCTIQAKDTRVVERKLGGDIKAGGIIAKVLNLEVSASGSLTNTVTLEASESRTMSNQSEILVGLAVELSVTFEGVEVPGWPKPQKGGSTRCKMDEYKTSSPVIFNYFLAKTRTVWAECIEESGASKQKRDDHPSQAQDICWIMDKNGDFVDAPCIPSL